MSPAVGELSLYDVMGTPGVAADVSHINTKAITKVRRHIFWLASTWTHLTWQNPEGLSALQGFMGDDQLGEALTGADLVIIPAGVPRKPGMTRDDLFKVLATPFLPTSSHHALLNTDQTIAAIPADQCRNCHGLGRRLRQVLS